MSARSARAADESAGEGPVAVLLRGFGQQRKVVYALAMRETQTRFERKTLGFAWLIGEPLLIAFVISAFKWAIETGETYPGLSVFVVSLVGYLPFFCFRAIVGRAPGSLRQNAPLLYHSKIKLLDVVLARHALEMAASVTVMTMIAFGLAFWGGLIAANIPLLFLGVVLLFLFANGLGLLAAAAAAVWPLAEKLIPPLVYISLPVSGALMALHVMDPGLRALLLWNPQAHLHEMIRYGFFGEALPSYYSIAYVCFWTGVFNILGLAALRAVRPKLEF